MRDHLSELLYAIVTSIPAWAWAAGAGVAAVACVAAAVAGWREGRAPVSALAAAVAAPLFARTPPCPTEDSTNCHWDAARGNGAGTSFATLEAPGVEVTVRLPERRATVSASTQANTKGTGR